uniref:Transmembrane protein n=1 Tax=Toxoplasma gondii (strain ATCC 50861 / VEG) TaxID=432359 RepID=A0A0F7VC62_TOXGV|nr:TPA: hypothetical protein BN1205_007000 [Toxoplasma gondii VEG]
MMKVQSLLLTFLLSLTVNRRPDGYLFAKVVIVTGVSLRNLAGQSGVRNSSKSPKVFTASQEVGDDGDIKSSGLPKVRVFKLWGARNAEELFRRSAAGSWGGTYGDLTAHLAGGQKGTAVPFSVNMDLGAFTQLAVSSESGSDKHIGDEKNHNGENSDSVEDGESNSGVDAKNDEENSSSTHSGETSQHHKLSIEHHHVPADGLSGSHVQWYGIRTNFPPRLLRLLAKTNETSAGQKWYTILTDFKPHILKLTPEH